MRAGVTDRIVVDRLDQGDRPFGDIFPVLGVELASDPRAGEAADQPDNDRKDEKRLDRDPPRLTKVSHGSSRESKRGFH